ncbi:MAG TPA: hypothetical protein ENJ80_08190 [Gammaproteobacteria bacterium]|nr:hypothetical protein [Gammaproteobacteria bacterium]
MKIYTALILYFMAFPLQAATYYREPDGLLPFTTRLKILPQYKTRHSPPWFMRFEIIHTDYSSTASLRIAFSHSEKEHQGLIGYRLMRDGMELFAENYIQRTGSTITLDLPALKADEKIIFLVGWENEHIFYKKINALLTTEQGTKLRSWTSRR